MPKCFPPDDGTRGLAWLVHLLSKRELQILYCVAKGVSTRDLAEYLAITEKTVKFHLTNIYHKLNIRNRVELIVFLYEQGLMDALHLIVPGGPCARTRRTAAR